MYFYYYYCHDYSINGKPCRTPEQKGCPNMIPGLRARHFWDPAQFQWTELLEQNFPRIRAEFQKLKDLGENFQVVQDNACR